MSSSPPSSRDFSPDDALPPVEPPSATFILQLFVVPGVIVLVVVMIWVMFNWLAQMGNDADAFVRALNRNNEGRWQAALNLANALRSEQGSSNPRLSVDSRLTSQLADILDREIAAGSLEPNAIKLRIFLCLALGQFRVPDALPTLVNAATIERGDAEADVRRAALEGIAISATKSEENARACLANIELREAIFKAASDPDPRTRSIAAVAMGVIGGDANLDRLRHMLDDAHSDVRYNAATRLAVNGDIASKDVLVEMLDPSEQASSIVEENESLQRLKRDTVTINAEFRAAHQLAEKNTSDDLTTLRTAIVAVLARRDLDPGARVEATAALRQLNESRGVPQ